MIDTAVLYPCLLGEGPVWDTLTATICWVDILSGEIHEFNPQTGAHMITGVHEPVGAVAICRDGNFLAALKSGLSVINRKTGIISLLGHAEPDLPGNRYNDGKCDPAGRFWIGTLALDESAGAGSLYMLDTNQQFIRRISGTTISNGMAWSHDQQTFYYIDTPNLSVVAYDFRMEDGHISNKRTIILFNEEEGYPDGMTIDTEGMLWIAHWGGWQLTRWNPINGKQLYSLALPVANVTSCTFGGAGLEDLYITTARKGLSTEELESQPLAGSLFVWKDSGFTGIKAVRYPGPNTE